MNNPPAAPPRRTLALLLALLAVVYLAAINHGLPNRDVVWGYDANPLLPLIAAKKVFIDGWNTGWHSPYPNFHYWVLLLFIGPYMAVQWVAGNLAGLRMEGGYPYGLQDFDILFMHLALITRLVSVAMALGVVWWVHRTARALHSHRAALFAACLAGFSPAVVYYVHVETLDVPMLFWLSAALYCYVRVLQSFELRHYLGLAVLAAVSTATKDYAYGAFVLLPLPLVAALARHAYGSIAPAALARAAFDRRHLLAAAAFVAAFAIAENWLWNFSGFVNHVKVAGGLETGDHVVTTSFGTLDLVSPLRLKNGFLLMTIVLGWVGLAVGLAGLAYCLLRQRAIAVLLLWPAASYYVFTICPVLPAHTFIERPYMPLGVMLAVPGGVLLARLAASPAFAARALAGLAVAGIALNGIAVDVALLADPRYEAERFLRDKVAAGAAVDFYGKRSELPRADPRWKSTVLNPDARPSSDVQLTAGTASAESLAARNADWIVVSEAFSRAYREDRGRTATESALHGFVDRLARGELPYEPAAHFRSPVVDALRLPDRYASRVTVYERRDRPGRKE